jgi:hypothetical protein
VAAVAGLEIPHPLQQILKRMVGLADRVAALVVIFMEVWEVTVHLGKEIQGGQLLLGHQRLFE